MEGISFQLHSIRKWHYIKETRPSNTRDLPMFGVARGISFESKEVRDSLNGRDLIDKMIEKDDDDEE